MPSWGIGHDGFERVRPDDVGQQRIADDEGQDQENTVFGYPFT